MCSPLRRDVLTFQPSVQLAESGRLCKRGFPPRAKCSGRGAGASPSTPERQEKYASYTDCPQEEEAQGKRQAPRIRVDRNNRPGDPVGRSTYAILAAGEIAVYSPALGGVSTRPVAVRRHRPEHSRGPGGCENHGFPSSTGAGRAPTSAEAVAIRRPPKSRAKASGMAVGFAAPSRLVDWFFLSTPAPKLFSRSRVEPALNSPFLDAKPGRRGVPTSLRSDAW